MKRPAFTLTELLAVMAALSVVMGVSVVLLLQAFDFQRTNDLYAEGNRAASRLVADFRSDVRTYGKPESLTDGEALLRWNTGTETIEYVTQPGEFADQRTVVRTVRKGETMFRETYRLPDRTLIWCVEGNDADAGLIALSLWTTPTGAKPPTAGPPTAGPPNLNDLNPFDRTLPKSHVTPKYAGNWRTIVARYSERNP